MIVRISRAATSGIGIERIRQRVLKSINGWLKVVPPFERGYLNVKFDDGDPIKINNSVIIEIINDERVNYQYCTYCGHSQKAGLDACSACLRGKDYLEPLSGVNYKDVSELASSAIKSAFGI